MSKEKCSDCEQLKVFKEVLLSSEALKPKLDRCLKVGCCLAYRALVKFILGSINQLINIYLPYFNFKKKFSPSTWRGDLVNDEINAHYHILINILYLHVRNAPPQKRYLGIKRPFQIIVPSKNRTKQLKMYK